MHSFHHEDVLRAVWLIHAFLLARPLSNIADLAQVNLHRSLQLFASLGSVLAHRNEVHTYAVRVPFNDDVHVLNHCELDACRVHLSFGVVDRHDGSCNFVWTVDVLLEVCLQRRKSSAHAAAVEQFFFLDLRVVFFKLNRRFADQQNLFCLHVRIKVGMAKHDLDRVLALGFRLLVVVYLVEERRREVARKRKAEPNAVGTSLQEAIWEHAQHLIDVDELVKYLKSLLVFSDLMPLTVFLVTSRNRPACIPEADEFTFFFGLDDQVYCRDIHRRRGLDENFTNHLLARLVVRIFGLKLNIASRKSPSWVPREGLHGHLLHHNHPNKI